MAKTWYDFVDSFDPAEKVDLPPRQPPKPSSNNAAKIKKLEAFLKDPGATPAEKETAKKLIAKLKKGV